MSNKLSDWIQDTFQTRDVLDLYFSISDLPDIYISDEEKYETACNDMKCQRHYDAGCSSNQSGVPIGKQVW